MFNSVSRHLPKVDPGAYSAVVSEASGNNADKFDNGASKDQLIAYRDTLFGQLKGQKDPSEAHWINDKIQATNAMLKNFDTFAKARAFEPTDNTSLISLEDLIAVNGQDGDWSQISEKDLAKINEYIKQQGR